MAAFMDASGTSNRMPRTLGQCRRLLSAAPELVPEEQDVHADHDGYQREHVKHYGCLSSHRSCLLCATEWSKGSTGKRCRAHQRRDSVWHAAAQGPAALTRSFYGCLGKPIQFTWMMITHSPRTSVR